VKEHSEIREMISHTVHEVDPKAKVILFGSRARGDSRTDSDWDVLIVIDSPKVTMNMFKSLGYELWVKGLEAGQEINPIIYTKSQWDNARPSLFRHHILEEGVVL